MTAHCLHMQIIMDMEEHPGGAVSNYVQISDIVRQMQQKVEAMHACHCYHISHVYTQVWKSLPCLVCARALFSSQARLKDSERHLPDLSLGRLSVNLPSYYQLAISAPVP